METLDHRRYLKFTLIVFLVVVSLVVFFNWVVNPYSLFTEGGGGSQDKPETFTHLRMVKAAQVRHLRPQALILGSSRAETGLDPSHPLWRAKPVYNLGLSDAGVYEIKRYFQHACALAPVKQAVVLLDFAAFTAGGHLAPDFREERLAFQLDGSLTLGLWWKDSLMGLATWDAVLGSFNTLARKHGEKRYLPDGSRDAKTEESRLLAKGGAKKAFAAYENRLLNFDSTQIQVLGKDELDCLKEILAIARRNKIDLRMAIAPLHARYLEILDFQGQWNLYEEWKRTMVRVVETEAAASQQSPFLLADFSGYNDFTTEAVPQQGLAKYYFEASHFTKQLGWELLTKLLGPLDTLSGAKPGGFGVLLKSASLEEHLVAIRDARGRYRESHKAEFENLKSRAHQVFLPEEARNR